MKIGVSTANLTQGGGMEHYALDIITSLLDRGLAPEVITRRFDPAHPAAKRLGPSLHKVAVGLIPGKFRNDYVSWRLDRLKKKLGIDVLMACGLANHPDLAICGGTHRGYLAAMGRTAGFTDRRQIAMEERQFAHARLVIAHSRLMQDELLHYYQVDPDKIRLIYPPVDHERFRPADADQRRELRKRFGFSDDRRIFLFPSGGHERKGLPFLREFFENTDLPVELAVAGRATGGRNIRSLGYVRDMEKLYPAVDATILAPLYEPFGLVGVESVLCGVPVLFPSSTGCTEVLKAPALISFRPGDRADLERAVRETVDRPSTPDLSLCVGYDCRVETHVDELLKLFPSVKKQ